jgi:hypothetical protein
MNLRMNVSGRDPKSINMPYFIAMEDLLAEINASADTPEGMDNMIQGAGAWTFMPSESMFVQNAI